jgi:sugar lactone lactonase YvrE
MNRKNRKKMKPVANITACAGLLLGVAAQAQGAGVPFSTIAGYAGHGSVDGTVATARFANAQGVAVDGSGNVYVADTGNNTIRVIALSGTVMTIAGQAGVSGSSNGYGTNALFNQPVGIAVDGAGNVYVADTGNDLMRMISPMGNVTTLAGLAGVAGSRDNPGTNALFNQPMGIALDAATNLYVADYGNDTIRKITPNGSVSTFAGSAGNFGFANASGTSAQFYQPEGIAVDGSGNVYVADTGNNAVRKITSGGAVTTIGGTAGMPGGTDASGTSALFYQPQGIAVDGSGNVYVSDFFNDNIREIPTSGATVTLCGLAETSGSADGANSGARFWGPAGMAITSGGTILVADSGNSVIRTVTTAGVTGTLAGSPSAGAANAASGLSARFDTPEGVVADGAGNIYVADTRNSVIRKMTPQGNVSTLAGFAGAAGAAGSADGAGADALFSGPQGIAADSAGNIYVADTGNGTIRKITSNGAVSTVAGTAGLNGSADGAADEAIFNRPEGVALDATGNIFVADSANDTIREITTDGTVATLAGSVGLSGNIDGDSGTARFNYPTGLAVDGSGNIFVADCLNDTIREITADGSVMTLAGLAGVAGSADGTNSGALFYQPRSLALDASGNIYVADSFNHTIREMTRSGTNWVVITLAGIAGTSGGADGAGAGAQFFFPAGITSGPAGQIFVADSGNNAIRINQFAAPLFSGLNLSGGTVSFSWSATVGQNYQVQYTASLTPANWISLGGFIKATSGTVSASDTPGANVQRFYRVVLVP